MSNDFIEGLLSGKLPAEAFNHKGHLYLGWLMLRQYPLTEAVPRSCFLIQHFASQLGMAKKFHATITMAAMLLIAERMHTDDTDFDQYLAREPALLEGFSTLIAEHYSASCLATDAAKNSFVAPDLKPFRLTIEEVLACTPLDSWPN